jgi:transcriptional regulator with XRE-family HTH domain
MLRVKEICKQKKITLKALAEKMDIAPESLNRMISSSGNPTLSSLVGIAKALDVQVYELFSDFDAEKSVRGFIEVGDAIHKINSMSDFTDLYNKLISE